MALEKLEKEKESIRQNLFQIESQYKTNCNYLEATNLALKEYKEENQELKAKVHQDQKVAHHIING